MHSQSQRNRMRYGIVVCIALVSGCLILSGCAVRGLLPAGPWNPPPPCVLPPNASLSEVVEHLNNNIAKLHAWGSTRVEIKTRGPAGLPVTLKAQIAVEAPHNFRLRARSIMGDEADFGSNSERFWFWLHRGHPYVFFARHDELQLIQQRMPVPLHPDWLMEALGVIPLDEQRMSLHRQGTKAGTAELISDRPSPDGRLVRHIMLVDTCRGVVLEHSLTDSDGRLIARATLKNYKTDPASGVTLPRRIDLHWPQSDLALTIDLGTVDINPDGVSVATWQLPQIRGCPPFNMGQRIRGQRLADDPRIRRDVHVPERFESSNSFATDADLEEPPWDTDLPASDVQPIDHRSRRRRWGWNWFRR